MAYTLTHSDGTSFVFEGEEWPCVLELLEQYGWEPAGTLSPRMDRSWDGTYLAPRGQKVGIEDAAAMATALESALPNIPDESRTAPDPVPQNPRAALRQALGRTDPREILRGPAKQRLRGFLEFVRSGEFRIGELSP